MTFYDDEGSVESSDYRELYLFEFPVATYRLARSDDDVIYNGATYKAAPIGRGDLAMSSVTGRYELTIELPLEHEVAQRYINQGIPPDYLRLTVWRYQVAASQARRVWSGKVTSGAIESGTLSMLVPSRLGEALERRIPTITTGPTCPHVLYDDNCKASRSSAGNTITRTVVLVDGPNVTFSGSAPALPWTAVDGDILHPATGSRRTLVYQSGTLVTMQYPIPGMATGDTILIARGCDHRAQTCQVSFNNIQNFGNSPGAPLNNPAMPGKNLGILR